MSIPATHDASTTAELARLRRTTIFACVLAATALALAGATWLRSARHAPPVTETAPAPMPATMEAPEFLLRDDQGAIRGRWNVTGFSLVDPSGRVRAGISASAGGAPNLTLFSKDGGVRAVVGLGAEDTPALTLHDHRSRVRARIAVGLDQVASITLFDDNGDVAARLPIAETKARRGRSR
jgi:hypothetical protein